MVGYGSNYNFWYKSPALFQKVLGINSVGWSVTVIEKIVTRNRV